MILYSVLGDTYIPFFGLGLFIALATFCLLGRSGFGLSVKAEQTLLSLVIVLVVDGKFDLILSLSLVDDVVGIRCQNTLLVMTAKIRKKNKKKKKKWEMESSDTLICISNNNK